MSGVQTIADANHNPTTDNTNRPMIPSANRDTDLQQPGCVEYEDVYKRLAVFTEHLARLGKSLGSSVDSFNKAVGSLEQQVLPAARRFPDLGLRVARELDALEPVAALVRAPQGAADGGNPEPP